MIDAPGTIEGISSEFAVLERMFGKRDIDWRLHDRLIDKQPNGRVIERFIIGHQGVRKEVEFDITSFFGIESQGEIGAIMQRTKERAEQTSLSISIPLEVSATLAMVIVGIKKNPQLAVRMKADRIVAAMNEAASGGVAAGDLQTISLPLSVWINLLGLLRSVKPNTLLDEELLEDLKAYIDGGLKSSRSNR
ncbi:MULTISPECIES: hypothetical protein [unclassified Novosphingobium]|uniref:hypothetical protein n=1 Tax=unclassified Novosphingobium TaxID=2644732 RepID=UPI0025E8D93F|nr:MULTISPECIES: hypothetical protein [unclassified Novosphingobium]HQV02167.1 hypothetical protein [Novosphingobium sp.]